MKIQIKNGTIVDGTGRAAFVGDVIVENDRIVDIVPRGEASAAVSSKPPYQQPTTNNQQPATSNQQPATSNQQPTTSNQQSSVIDATGCLVTPGFIDAHSHSDAYLVLEPDVPSKISQGVTTEINGQCGGSIAPRYGEARLSSDWASLLGDRLTWRSMAEYREVLGRAKPAINTVQFVGHNTLRSSVVGYAGRASTPDELRTMQRLLEQSLDEGGWGLTTGLIYQPGKYATNDEVVALAKTAAAKGGFYATHMRSEGDRILESIDEVLDLVRTTGIRAEISHLKTSGPKNWHKIDAVLEKIEGAIDAGLLLGSDRYPYCAAGTDLDVVLPDWAQEGAAPAELARIKNEELRMKIVAEINAQDRDWSQVMIGGTWDKGNKQFSGKTVAEILGRETRDKRQESQVSCLKSSGSRLSSHVSCPPLTPGSLTPGSLVCDILAADACRTGAFFFGMSEENLAKIYSRPWIVPGSDASLRAPWGPLGADHPHPRAYGTMPEFYRRVRALGFSREETVARMTSVPARRFDICGRGTLEKGAFADIVVWNESEFRATATFSDPHRFSDGVRLVMVNGTVPYKDGKLTGSRGGRFLSPR